MKNYKVRVSEVLDYGHIGRVNFAFSNPGISNGRLAIEVTDDKIIFTPDENGVAVKNNRTSTQGSHERMSEFAKFSGEHHVVHFNQYNNSFCVMLKDRKSYHVKRDQYKKTKSVVVAHEENKSVVVGHEGGLLPTSETPVTKETFSDKLKDKMKAAYGSGNEKVACKLLDLWMEVEGVD